MPSRPASAGDPSLDRIATVPNLISLIRILSIPVFVILLQRRQTEVVGLVVLVLVLSTDWVDGRIARRTGQVTNVGKTLDPVADRLALASALVALTVRGIFPLWATLVVVLRDALLLASGAVLLLLWGVRLEVRRSGKIATFALMAGVPLIAWGEFDRFLAGPALAVGWPVFLAGLAIYLFTTMRYVRDARQAVRDRSV
ncbi:MAG: CDP-alcohol phosphatidyltransferase family protein [Actinobacteria bacterium]|nr:CDP-alcohol phosphatidyltransferase family protein [Actinomycetota bacterium]